MAKRGTDGTFQPGNNFWKLRSTHGLKPKFEKTEEGAQKLADACMQYFEACASNPITNPAKPKDTRPRVMTIFGLCTFLGMSHRAWNQWKDASSRKYRTDLVPIMREAETCMAAYSVELAGSGFANSSIVARVLNLADTVDHQSSDGSMTPPTEVRLVGVRAENQEDD